MPNWKKVIVSGSNAVLNSLYVAQSVTASIFTGSVQATQLTASGLRYPTTDGASGQFIVTNGTGTLSFGNNNVLTDQIRSGEAISIGDPLYVSGSNGTRPIVWKADASNPAKMPVIYIAQASVGANTNTTGITLGDISGVTTTGYPVGTTIYVAEGGGWTSSRPSGSNSIVQALGIVTKEGPGGSGVGLVLNPGPATLPNLQTGYTWVGNGSNQPVTVATASLSVASASYSNFALTASYALNAAGGGGGATTGSNTFYGDQTISGSLTVTGSASANIFLYPQTASNVVIPPGHNGLLLTPIQLQGTSSVDIGARLVIL